MLVSSIRLGSWTLGRFESCAVVSRVVRDNGCMRNSERTISEHDCQCTKQEQTYLTSSTAMTVLNGDMYTLHSTDVYMRTLHKYTPGNIVETHLLPAKTTGLRGKNH